MAMRDMQTDYLPDLLRGNTEALLLFLVNELENTYGYQLIKEIQKRSQGFFQFKEGTVYPALRKLENEGLLQGEWQQTPNGQERRYYHITDKGKEVLQAKLAMWRNFTAAVNLILKPTGS
ncbi:MAG: PadR family transcriptional regulator [Chloroflexi bacterium]|nr:PadR family transcriptional regulator [Chloroflexota bacterium]